MFNEGIKGRKSTKNSHSRRNFLKSSILTLLFTGFSGVFAGFSPFNKKESLENARKDKLDSTLFKAKFYKKI